MIIINTGVGVWMDSPLLLHSSVFLHGTDSFFALVSQHTQTFWSLLFAVQVSGFPLTADEISGDGISSANRVAC